MSAKTTHIEHDFTEGWHWEHCSPALLAEGVPCGLAPRRACACDFTGSHDHLVQRGWPDDREPRRGTVRYSPGASS